MKKCPKHHPIWMRKWHQMLVKTRECQLSTYLASSSAAIALSMRPESMYSRAISTIAYGTKYSSSLISLCNCKTPSRHLKMPKTNDIDFGSQQFCHRILDIIGIKYPNNLREIQMAFLWQRQSGPIFTYCKDCSGLLSWRKQAPFSSRINARFSTSYLVRSVRASKSCWAFSMSLYTLSAKWKCLPNTLNAFHRYISSTAGSTRFLFSAKKRSAFLIVNFSIGNDFPAMRCLYWGTSLPNQPKTKQKTKKWKRKSKCLIEMPLSGWRCRVITA